MRNIGRKKGVFYLDGKNLFCLPLLFYLLFLLHGKSQFGPGWMSCKEKWLFPPASAHAEIYASRLRDSGGFPVRIFCLTNLVLRGTGTPQVCVNNMGLNLRKKRDMRWNLKLQILLKVTVGLDCAALFQSAEIEAKNNTIMHVNRFSPCVSRCRRDQRMWLGELWDMRSQPSSLAAALEKRQRYRRDAFINRINSPLTDRYPDWTALGSYQGASLPCGNLL